MDDELIEAYRRAFDAPADTSDEEIIGECRRRFILVPPQSRKTFVDELHKAMLDDEIGLRQRAERVALHREFAGAHQALKALGK